MGKKLYRNTNEKMIGGVVAGIGQYFNIDATILRVGIVILTVITAVIPAILIYLLIWVIVPEQPAPNVPYGQPPYNPPYGAEPYVTDAPKDRNGDAGNSDSKMP
jgi:phage shock protein C